MNNPICANIAFINYKKTIKLALKYQTKLPDAKELHYFVSPLEARFILEFLTGTE